MDITSPRSAGRLNVFVYFKSIDTVNGGARKKVHRIWNNEFIFKNAASGRFMDLQAFGNSIGLSMDAVEIAQARRPTIGRR